MSQFLQFLLVSHVLLGLLGIVAFYAILMGILQKNPNLTFLIYTSLTGFISTLLSWFSGGYYYVSYYGGQVKPIITEGAYPWAHLIFMEAKEHVFLMLPFASLVLLLAFLFSGQRMLLDGKLKYAVALLAAIATVVGTFIAIAGILVSGAAR